MTQTATANVARPKAASTKPTTRSASRKKAAAKPFANGKGSSPKTPAPAGSRLTKRQQLADLLVRDQGATLDQMVGATGWLSHTVRAAMTGLRKAGYRLDSDRVDGLRTWRAVAP